jgi:hypothetical protein
MYSGKIAVPPGGGGFRMKSFIIALKNDTLGHFFKANECKNEPLWNFFLTLLDRFKNHIYYERKE